MSKASPSEYVQLGHMLCNKSQKIIYQCYMPIFMVLKIINYFLLASDLVINYLTTRDEKFTTNSLICYKFAGIIIV